MSTSRSSISRALPSWSGIAQQMRRPAWLAPCVLVVAVLVSDFARAQSPIGSAEETKALPKVNPDGWTSSAVCGECHQAIHAVWQHSLHAKAWTNGIFQAAYHRSVETYGKEGARACLPCHTPTVRYGNDFDVKRPITAEGVTCDFCHSVSAVDLSDPADPVRFTVGKTKYGPLRHAQSPAHEVVNSELHKKSEFCASCHEYKNANGITVLGTYSEWKGSSYAKRGTQCQDCHMPLVPGRVVALNIKDKTADSVNLHDISGSHDIDRVREAVKLNIEGYEWVGDRLWIHLVVANEGSGHCFPTGMPMHRAVLEVTIEDNGSVVGKREIPFEAVMMDKERRPLHREHEVMLQAASLWNDTRLKPNERREIEIAFRDVKAKRLAVSAKLYYMYSTETMVEKDGEKHIEPAEMKFLLVSKQNTMKPLGG